MRATIDGDQTLLGTKGRASHLTHAWGGGQQGVDRSPLVSKEGVDFVHEGAHVDAHTRKWKHITSISLVEAHSGVAVCTLLPLVETW
jgi:hypothetical protein